MGVVYVAVSATSSATGSWLTWSENPCTLNSNATAEDQPLLGWSQSLVVIDTVCFNAITNSASNDSLIVIQNSNITNPVLELPSPIAAPCRKMTPARDEQGSFPSLYLLASIVPGDSFGTNLPNCAPATNNTDPFLVEYTSTVSGGHAVVQGFENCTAGQTGCAPVSESPQWGNPALYVVQPNAQQPGCGPSSNCTIRLNDARALSSQIINTKELGSQQPVLAIGFMTGLAAANSQSQNVWFVQDVTSTNWLETFAFVTSGNWYTFPTIAIDSDADIYLVSSNFQATATQRSIWDEYKGVVPTRFLSQNILETSTGSYTGISGDNVVRWGDYNALVYDSSAVAPNGEGVFWQVEETTTGGTNETTTWNALSDTLPYYISYSASEGECAVPPGDNCSVTVQPPANLQSGDTIVAFIDMAGQFPTPPTPPDSSWVVLPIANMSNATSMQSGNCSKGDLMTEYAFAHIYASSDPTSYKFKHIDEHYCNGDFAPEMEGFLVGYRSGSSNTANYVLYGYPASQISSTVTVGAAPSNAPSDGTLLNVFYGSGFENNDSGEYGNLTFSSLTGMPTATAETPLSPPDTVYLLADVDLSSSNPLAQYSVDTARAHPRHSVNQLSPNSIGSSLFLNHDCQNKKVFF